MTRPAVERHAYARAGLLGNPSDGYFGRTLSVILRNFRATIRLEESSDLRIEAGPEETGVYRSFEHLNDSIRTRGYYGGSRLVMATLKVFHDYCQAQGIAPEGGNFIARYQSSIPRQVGLAGSSAIVTATLRALMAWHDVEIPQEDQPTLILSAEMDELGITAGLQDRVCQVYEGLVYMDFSREVMRERGHGAYDPLDPSLLPPLFVAYSPNPTKVSGRVLDDVRTRWEAGDEEVHDVLSRIAAVASEGRSALQEGAHETFFALMNENFDLRRRIMRVSEADIDRVEAVRGLGGSAKLTGSGGAIIGAVPDEDIREAVSERLQRLGAEVIRPITTAETREEVQ